MTAKEMNDADFVNFQDDFYNLLEKYGVSSIDIEHPQFKSICNLRNKVAEFIEQENFYTDLGLLRQGKEVIIYTLKLSYLKIAFFDCLLYHSSAGKVFLHFVQIYLLQDLYFACTLKKSFPPKIFQQKKIFSFFS
jgi:hypothetical protein